MSGVAGILLAAGRGRRMGALGDHRPKTLLPVGGEPLAAHHLRLFHRLGIERVFVVVGFRGDEVRQELGDGGRFGLELVYLEQRAALGSAHALGLVRAHHRGPVVLVLGDYWFAVSEPERVMRRLAAGEGAIAARREPDPRLIAEACELTVDGDGRVRTIVEKPAVPVSDLKGCGFYALPAAIFDAVARTPRTALRDEYELSVALELFIAAGNPLYAEEILLLDTNLTRAEDLLECNLQWLRHHGRDRYVADGAQVAPGTRLVRTVIGAGARVAGDRELCEVVVFPGARLDGDGEVLRSALVTGEGILHCPRPQGQEPGQPDPNSSRTGGGKESDR